MTDDYSNIEVDVSYEDTKFICVALGKSMIKEGASMHLFDELVEKIPHEHGFIEKFHEALGNALFNDHLIASIKLGLVNDPNLSQADKESLFENEERSGLSESCDSEGNKE